jgi:hypothetical protein
MPDDTVEWTEAEREELARLLEPFDVEAAAKAHHTRLMGHDLPVAERLARIRGNG